jgi:hypothetical protein
MSRLRVPTATLPALALALALAAPAAPVSAAATVVDGTTGPACATGSVSDAAKAAAAVFTGTVHGVARDEISAQETDYVQSVTVDRVYKPSRDSVIDTEEVELVTQQTRSGCSLGALREGQRYVVFAGLSGEMLLATGDSGTAPADAALVAEVEGLLGTGRPAVAPAEPTATLTPVASATPVPFVRAAVPGAVLVLVGLVGLLVTRRLNRSS